MSSKLESEETGKVIDIGSGKKRKLPYINGNGRQRARKGKKLLSKNKEKVLRINTGTY